MPHHRKCIVRAREEVSSGKGEIIVIDQASEDGTQWYLREALKEGLIDVLQILPKTVGASISRNIGINLANYDRVLLLDGDIVMPRNWVSLANSYLDSHPEHEAISIYPALCTDKEGKHTDSLTELKDIQESRTSCTNLGVYRKSYLKAVPFPEHGAFADAGWGFEDTYQSQRGMDLGYKWVHVYEQHIQYLHPLNSSRKLLRQILGTQEADRRTAERHKLLTDSVIEKEEANTIGGVVWNDKKRTQNVS